ncbi:DUF4956 domain-containing protein [Gammaproteobacteria bacterium]|nr:DUF4956 domain-containing protein [Gammaproteobacteria bacterium]
MNFINPYDIIEIPILEFIRNLAVGLVLAVMFAWLVKKSTRLVVDTTQYMPLFLLLIPTMILIITVIKTSIALSLGLVGALSIIRFRTPIKEPEELAYIFIAIAIGLGLGANQVLATVVGFAVVAIVMLPAMFKRSAAARSHNAYIDIVLEPKDGPKFDMEVFTSILDQASLKYLIKRVTETSERNEITLQVPELDMAIYEKVKTELSNRYQTVEISIIDNARVIT